ncbi:hypothetical protein, partial [Streptomyces sp. NPDC056061]|uniref:hypothetical protein n=1 Tax=Streptomyces sp. NPDC056061 TaxID=3345700 RepID=UPI0035D99C9E
RIFPRGRHRLGSSHETHLTCCHLSPHLGGTSTHHEHHRRHIICLLSQHLVGWSPPRYRRTQHTATRLEQWRT